MEYTGVFNEILNLLKTKGLKQNSLKIQYQEPHKVLSNLVNISH